MPKATPPASGWSGIRAQVCLCTGGPPPCPHRPRGASPSYRELLAVYKRTNDHNKRCRPRPDTRPAAAKLPRPTHPVLETITFLRARTFLGICVSQGPSKRLLIDSVHLLLLAHTNAPFSSRTESPGYPCVISRPRPHLSLGFRGLLLGMILGRAGPGHMVLPRLKRVAGWSRKL